MDVDSLKYAFFLMNYPKIFAFFELQEYYPVKIGYIIKPEKFK